MENVPSDRGMTSAFIWCVHPPVYVPVSYENMYNLWIVDWLRVRRAGLVWWHNNDRNISHIGTHIQIKNYENPKYLKCPLWSRDDICVLNPLPTYLPLVNAPHASKKFYSPWLVRFSFWQGRGHVLLLDTGGGPILAVFDDLEVASYT